LSEDPYELDDDDPYEDFSEPADDQGEWADQGQANQPPQLPPQYQQPGQPRYAPSRTTINCMRCGYNLTGVTIGGNCPECGAGVDASFYNSSGPLRANGLAITSMVLGILSLPTFCCCVLSIPLAIAGLIFGIVAMTQLKDGNYTNGSRGMAIAGLICSGIALLLTAVWFIISVVGGTYTGP